MKRTLLRVLLFLFILLLNTACNAEVTAPPTTTIVPTSTPLAFITATLPATQIPYSSPMVEVAPSAVPVIGTTPLAENNASTTEASSNESVPTSTLEPAPVLATAPPDGDSAENPAINITLSESSVPVLQYSSDISYPEGDAEDWVKFSLEGQQGQEQIVSVVIKCSGSGKLNLELLQNGVPLQKWEDIRCGQPSQLQLYLYVSAPYTLRLSPAQGGAVLKYLTYDLTVQLTK